MPPRVVNMVPFANSGETRQDSEPNLTVNPSNPQQMVGSAFTTDPAGGVNAPVYVSTDGGENWVLNLIVPSQGFAGTGDITVRFGTTTNILYAGILRSPAAVGLRLNILRTTNFTAATPMTVLVDRDTSPGPDQPYLQAATTLGGGAGRDRVYVGTNDRPGVGTRTSSVDWSLDGAAATPPPPSGFQTRIVETRATPLQDGFACRPALHHDGTVYIAFLAWRTFTGGNITSDVCIVRDDNWATGATPFSALSEPPAPAGDGLVGVRLATGITLPGSGTLGQTRLGSSMLTIAVDPRDHRTVYVGWSDIVGATATPTVHVRRSLDSGQTWSGDVRTIGNAINPALAVNSRGKVGLLYQRLTGTAPTTRWESHLELTLDNWATSQDFTLATTPSNAPAPTFQPYLGDYVHLVCIGKNFYGVFSANNTPNNANFPQGVRYQRASNFTTQQLFQTNGVTPVAVSIDPFFFRQTELAADVDFYVRDWTDSAASADTGLEPSSHPVFYTTSDVWNRQADNPGAFNANDQPANEPARNGPGIAGRNWAFARVHRGAAGSAATVTLRFLVSPLGTGSNYQLAGTGADPTLSFAPAEQVKTMTDGRRWQLNEPMTTHVCLAVEVSTPADPIVAPSLLGRAPGWPTTDLAVLYDNNKAQRNLQPAPGGSAGTVTVYALIHNAATWRRDVVLRFAGELGDPHPRVRVIGGEGKASRREVVLPAMTPGENRWLSFSVAANQRGREPWQLLVEELVDRSVVNGFAIAVSSVPDEEFARGTLRYHATVLWRLASAFGMRDMRAHAEAAFKAGDDRRGYARIVRDAFEQLPGWVKTLVGGWDGGDPFGLQRQVRALVGMEPGSPEAVAAHSSLLHALDSFATMRLTSDGDLADVLQTVAWTARLLSERRLRNRDNGEVLLACEEFEATYSQRDGRPEEYVDLMRRIHEGLAQIADSVGVDPALAKDVGDALGDARGLQGAHRRLLIGLGEAIGGP